MKRVWDRLVSMTEHEAREAIAAMRDDTVLAFWEWNDREAALCIAQARDGVADYTLDAVAESLRDSLVGDVVAEIRHRCEVANANS